MESLNRPGYDRQVDSKKEEPRTDIRAFLNEQKHFNDFALESGNILEIPDTPVPDSLESDTNRLAAQVAPKPVYPLSSSPSMIDGVPIDEQPTWFIPVIPKQKRATKLEIRTHGTEEYTSVIRSLVKSSGVYALASFISPLITLVLAPYLTRNLSRADYGVLAVFTTVIALMVGITQLGLNHAFFRAYNYDYESKGDRLKVVSTLIVLLLVISIPVTVALVLAAPWLSMLLFSTQSYDSAVRIAALVILLQNLTLPGFAWLRAENRPIYFSVLSTLNLLVSLGTTIILVGMVHLGIVGALIATGVGYGIVAFCTLPVVLLRVGLENLRPRRDIVWNLVSFGFPLVGGFIAVWVLQLSDRYLLSRLGTLEQTASYAVAYSLGGIMSVIVLGPFALAWPSAMFTIAKRADAPYIFQLIFRWYSLVLLLIAFAFSLVSMIILVLFFPPAYHSAAPVIPIVAVSTMFYGLYSMFNAGIGVRRKNWLGVIFTTFSALLNVGLNIVLIPHYGSLGAALSTLIAYLALALIAYVVNHYIYPIPYEIGLFLIALSVGVALFLGTIFLTRTVGLYVTSAIYIGMFCAYGACLILLGGIRTRNHKRKNPKLQEDSSR